MSIIALKQPLLIKKVLFNFLNLNISIKSNNKLELSNLPSSFREYYKDNKEYKEEEEDNNNKQYKLSNTKDKGEEPTPILPLLPILPPTPTPILLGAKPPLPPSLLPKALKKEYIIRARIRAITIIDNRITITRIIKVTSIPRT